MRALALNQPTTAAAALLGNSGTYTDLPFFYSDQYDLGMEYLGQAAQGSYDHVVVRGDVAKREFVAFWLDSSKHIKAAMNVNVWDVLDQITPLIIGGKPIDLEKLADPAVSYSSL